MLSLFLKCANQGRLNFVTVTNHLKKKKKENSVISALMKPAANLGDSPGQLSSILSNLHGFLLGPLYLNTFTVADEESEGQTSVVNCFGSKFGHHFHFPFFFFGKS